MRLLLYNSYIIYFFSIQWFAVRSVITDWRSRLMRGCSLGRCRGPSAPRLIKALCTLAERENQLFIVAPCPAPSLTHVYRHTTLQQHTLCLSMFIHTHTNITPHKLPKASGSSVTVQTGHHPRLLFIFQFFLSFSPPSPPPTSSLECRGAQLSKDSYFSLIPLLVILSLALSPLS